MPATVVSPPDPTIGAMLIGSILGAVAYGFTASQGYMYYTRSLKEPLPIRLFVFATWLFDTANTAFMTHMQYHYFLNNYANPAAFMTPVWSLVAMVLLTAVVSFMVRAMFIRSVYQMSYQNPVPAIILGLLSSFNLVCGVIATVKFLGIEDGDFQNIKVFVYLDFVSAIAADISVAAALLVYLRSHKGASVKTQSMLQKLQMYIIGTGSLTVVIAVVALITFAAMPHKFVFLTPFMIWSKFYTNALLSSLNTAKRANDAVVSVSLNNVTTPRYPGQLAGSNNTQSGQITTGPEITIQRITESDEDLKASYPLGKGL
ncbi:hypothetical protein L227DRAFT_570750 [Lentinus tigrinus ALCF2SS1-6]|uniref:DUF6534 domain-containing protein n=1 Tax=Lentinus tigrinus ALCF2SS1-6 TaxID=1328759 RepID=A0A5C2SW60_9APHY|nr:hypothetical protein L227DRAFT_570750 [Lentinus tigrinus ALCF2SS1-6]